MPSLTEVTDRLDREGLEYVVTPLEPIDGSKNGKGDLEAHVVQYYNKTGDDIVVLVAGTMSKVVCLSGYFHTPIAMKELF